MNSVNLAGRLSKDPELRHTAAGIPYCYVLIGIDRDQKQKDGKNDADWPVVSLWRQSAEFVCDYAAKGDLLIIQGKIRTRIDDKTGQKITEVMADRVELGGSKKSSSSGSTKKSPSTKKQQSLPAATPEQIAQWEFEETGKEIDPDELPF